MRQFDFVRLGEVQTWWDQEIPLPSGASAWFRVPRRLTREDYDALLHALTLLREPCERALVIPESIDPDRLLTLGEGAFPQDID